MLFSRIGFDSFLSHLAKVFPDHWSLYSVSRSVGMVAFDSKRGGRESVRGFGFSMADFFLNFLSDAE